MTRERTTTELETQLERQLEGVLLMFVKQTSIVLEQFLVLYFGSTVLSHVTFCISSFLSSTCSPVRCVAPFFLAGLVFCLHLFHWFSCSPVCCLSLVRSPVCCLSGSSCIVSQLFPCSRKCCLKVEQKNPFAAATSW